MSSDYNTLRNSQQAQPTTTSERYTRLTENGKYYFKNAGYSCTDDRRVVNLATPVSTIPANLSNAQVEFKINADSIDVLDYPVLAGHFLNDSLAAASMAGLAHYINRIEIVSPSGETLWSTVSQELLLSNLFLDKSTFEEVCYASDLSTVFQPNFSSVGTGQHLEVYMPIWGFFKSCKLAIFCIPYLTVRIIFNPSSRVIQTGAEMKCSNLQLLLVGKKLKTSSKNAIIDVYRNPRISTSLSHLAVDRITETRNLSSGQQVEILLQGARGICSLIFVTVRKEADINTPSGACLYHHMDKMQILDSAGNSLLGSYVRPPKFRYFLQGVDFGNSSASLGLDMIVFSTDPVGSFARGEVDGYCVITGQEKLTFIVPTDSFVNGNYVIDVRCYMYENLNILNGNLSVSNY